MGAAPDGHDVDGAELGALEVRGLALGEGVVDVELDLDPPLGLLLEGFVENAHGLVERARGTDGRPRLENDRGLGEGGGRQGEGDQGRQEDGQASMHVEISSGCARSDWGRALIGEPVVAR